ncbi:hypothetical protein [Roseicella aquatilis]|uniref:Uncharacterized protein n=1 Tax=Roseicella aquatilis TaxID=2527868 RepID=A0A4R4D5Y2_9PROT|nr:hypothetical protein [Roseicella aquatilis]TCZ53914.1 hypothetical protein EXY23_23755 [Roseicella aquatilis]
MAAFAADPAPAGQEPGLRPVDRALMRGWVATHPDWPPPPLAAEARARLQPGRPLPPGIEARPLPPALTVRLTYFPGYRYLAAGADLLLVAARTGLVASILPDAFLPQPEEAASEGKGPPPPVAGATVPEDGGHAPALAGAEASPGPLPPPASIARPAAMSPAPGDPPLPSGPAPESPSP